MSTRQSKFNFTCFTAILATGMWAKMIGDRKFYHPITDQDETPAEFAQTLSLQIRGAELSDKGTLRRMAPESLTVTVAISQEPGAKIEEQALDTIPASPTFAPFSVNIYEFPVK